MAPQIGAIKVYPNPTKDKVRLEVTLQQPAHVQLSIFNLAGEIVSEITNRELASGTHRFSWDGTGFNGTALPDSIYLYEAIIGEQKLAGKIHLAH